VQIANLHQRAAPAGSGASADLQSAPAGCDAVADLQSATTGCDVVADLQSATTCTCLHQRDNMDYAKVKRRTSLNQS